MRGDEEEGNEEGCQEKVVVFGTITLGAAPPSALIIIHTCGIRQVDSL